MKILLNDKLALLRENCSQGNWDGDGAHAIDDAVFDVAADFVSALPPIIEQPLVVAMPEGGLSFEWRKSDDMCLSVGVDKFGELTYAGIFGNDIVYGVDSFSGILPGRVLDLILRVFV